MCRGHVSEPALTQLGNTPAFDSSSTQTTKQHQLTAGRGYALSQLNNFIREYVEGPVASSKMKFHKTSHDLLTTYIQNVFMKAVAVGPCVSALDLSNCIMFVAIFYRHQLKAGASFPSLNHRV